MLKQYNCPPISQKPGVNKHMKADAIKGPIIYCEVNLL